MDSLQTDETEHAAVELQPNNYSWGLLFYHNIS
jgi:hypothetical protein